MRQWRWRRKWRKGMEKEKELGEGEKHQIPPLLSPPPTTTDNHQNRNKNKNKKKEEIYVRGTCMTRKVYNIHSLGLYRNCSPTPAPVHRDLVMRLVTAISDLSTAQHSVRKSKWERTPWRTPAQGSAPTNRTLGGLQTRKRSGSQRPVLVIHWGAGRPSLKAAAASAGRRGQALFREETPWWPSENLELSHEAE